MPRHKTISDEDVLVAALGVLSATGVRFTLSDVASAVGLSRATLIQRFGDREALLRRMAQHQVAVTRDWLSSLPLVTGKDGLWSFLTQIVESMGSGEGFSSLVEIAALEMQDKELRILAGERYRLVEAAIAERLGEHPHASDIAQHLHTIIAGATMRWCATDGSMPAPKFILHRLKWFLDMVPEEY